MTIQLQKNEVSLLFKEIAKSIFDFSPSITISGLATIGMDLMI